MIALVLAMGLGAWSGPPAVRITVLDASSQKPLPDVRVQLSTLGDELRILATAVTDASGIASVDAPSSGRYVLSVATLGYGRVRQEVVVTQGATLALTVQLSEGTGTYQEDVIVAARSGGTREVGVSTQETLDAAAIQDLRGIATDDPMRAVQALPGVATGDDFQAEFSVRGSAFRHVGLVIDGTPAPLLLHAVRGRDDTGSLAMVNADLLERASLLSGPHPQRHGEWLGATLDFGLRPGLRDRVRAHGTVSASSATLVLEGPLGQRARGAWVFSIRKNYVDWLIRKLDPDIVSTIGFSDAQSKFAWDLSRRQQLQVVLVGGEAVYREPDTSIANGLHKAVSIGAMASIAWLYTGEAVTWQQRVSATTSRFTNTGMLDQVQGQGVTTTRMWRGDGSKALGTRWLIEGGAQAAQTTVDQTLTRYSRVGQLVRRISSRSVEGSRQVLSAWGQTTIRGSRGGLVVGARGGHHAGPDGQWVAPWTLGEWQFGRVTTRMSAGLSRQLPPIEASAGGFDVAPERARSVDASLDVRLPSALRFQVAAFHRQEHNILRPMGEARVAGGVYVAEATFPVVASHLDGASRGLDVMLQRAAPPSGRGLSGWVAYTWARTHHTDRVSGEQFDGDTDQRHTVNVFLQQRFSTRSAVNAKLRVGSNVPVTGYFTGDTDHLFLSDRRNQVRLPWYVRLDLRANRVVTINGRRVTLFAELVNALGRRNLGLADGVVRLPGLQAEYFTEKLIPRIPSVGFQISF